MTIANRPKRTEENRTIIIIITLPIVTKLIIHKYPNLKMVKLFTIITKISKNYHKKIQLVSFGRLKVLSKFSSQKVR